MKLDLQEYLKGPSIARIGDDRRYAGVERVQSRETGDSASDQVDSGGGQIGGQPSTHGWLPPTLRFSRLPIAR